MVSLLKHVFVKFSLAEKRQAGLSQTGFRNRGMIGQMGVHHYQMDHLMQHLQATGKVDENPRSGMPLNTTPREDRLIARYARINRCATSTRILDEVYFGCHVSVRTVDMRINGERLGARLPIQLPQL